MKNTNGLKRRNMVIAVLCVTALLVGVAGTAIAKTNSHDSSVTMLQESDQTREYVEKVFEESINKYTDGKISYEQISEYIAKTISEDLRSTNSFTDNQVDAMEVVITECIEASEISQTTKYNQQQIKEIASIIETQYYQNIEKMQSIEVELTSLIAETKQQNADSYKELDEANKRVQRWLGDSERTLNDKINDTTKRIDKDLADAKETINTKMDEAIEQQQKDLADTKAELQEQQAADKAEIESNMASDKKELSDKMAADKTEIESQMASDKKELSDKMAADKAEIESQMAADKAELTTIINTLDKTLTDEIAAKDSAIRVLVAEMNQTINQNIATLKANLESEINVLSESTTNRFTETNNNIVSLDEKYSVNFKQAFSKAIAWNGDVATVTFTGDMIKSYSTINIVYDAACQTGYTVSYEQLDGSLVLTLTKVADAAAPSTLSGTLYVDNGSVNAADHVEATEVPATTDDTTADDTTATTTADDTTNTTDGQ